MENEQNIKEKIAFYRIALGLVVGFLIVFIVGGGIMIARWYQQYQGLTIERDIESGLLQTDFDQLERTLQQRTISLESKMEIMYGKDIGKLEPFQNTIQQE